MKENFKPKTMKNSAKVIFALIVTVVVTGYAVSCTSKTETANTTTDTTKVDTVKVAPEVDTTAQSTDTTTTH
jgi:hypothetical protein